MNISGNLVSRREPADAVGADLICSPPDQRQEPLLSGLTDQVSIDIEEALRIAKLGIWCWVVGTSDFTWSNELYRIAGRDPAHFAPTLESTFGCIHADDREATLARLMDAARDQAPYEREFRIVRPDGSERHCWAKVRPVVENGATVAVRGICLDVTDRWHAQHRLAQSEEHYRNTIELSPQMPWTADPEGNLLSISPRWTAMTGLPVEAALGPGWLQRVHPADAAQAAGAVASALRAGTPLDMVVRLCCADGSYRWMRARAAAKPGADGRIERWYGLSEDIHDQVVAEQALRDSEERYQLAARATNDLIWDWDLQSDRIRWNQAVGDRLGYDGTQLGTDCAWWESRIHPDDRERILARLEAFIGGDADHFSEEYRFRRADGEWAHIHDRGYVLRDADGQPVRAVGAMQDLTERKQAVDTLRQRERQLQTIFGQAMVGLTYCSAEGRTWIANDRFCQIVGRTSEELRRITFKDFTHPDDLAENDRLFAEHVRTGEPFQIEKRYLRPDGTAVWCDVHVSFVRDDEGAVHSCIVAVADITERRAAAQKLASSQHLLQTVIDSVQDLIFVKDREGRFVLTNRALDEGCGGLLGQRTQDFFEEDLTDGYEQVDRKVIATGQPQTVDEVIPIAGERRLFQTVKVPWRSGDEIAGIIGVSRDITERKQAEERVRWSATHDALTGLPNRVLFQERLAAEIASAERNGGGVALLLLDVDHFKEVNDALGHDAGDQLLKTFGERLRGIVRAGDLVSRLGGDEFAILLPGLASDQHLGALEKSVLARLREPFVYQGRVIDCRASIGASVYPLHGATPDDLLKAADIALYRAKTAGRGGLIVFSPEMRAELQQRSAMISTAREAIRDGRILPYYQPKLELGTGRVVGFEALLRCRDGGGGVQPPGILAAAFEDLDLAAAISDCMLDQAVLDMQKWLDRGTAFGHVAINASAADFRRGGFAEHVLETLRRARIPTSRLQVEVTETVFIGRGAEEVSHALHVLNANGVKIALDDFGTGYASLRHLKEYPVSSIKIDRSFVLGMEGDPSDEAIIRSIISLGRSLDLIVVAEGIETDTQAEHLRRLGCAHGQGFLFSRAVEAAKVAAFVGERGLG